MSGGGALLERGNAGPWGYGAQPTLRRLCLVPQGRNALRHDCDLSPYSAFSAAFNSAANSHNPAFDAAQPHASPDLHCLIAWDWSKR